MSVYTVPEGRREKSKRAGMESVVSTSISDTVQGRGHKAHGHRRISGGGARVYIAEDEGRSGMREAVYNIRNGTF